MHYQLHNEATHHLQWSSLGNKEGRGAEDNLIPYKKYITTSAAVSVRRPFYLYQGGW